MTTEPDSSGSERSARISLAPLDPREALRALLHMPPVDDRDRNDPEDKGAPA